MIENKKLHLLYIVVFCIMVSCNKKTPRPDTIVEGHVSDSTSSQGISGLRITLQEGGLMISPEVVAETKTDSSGYYSIIWDTHDIEGGRDFSGMSINLNENGFTKQSEKVIEGKRNTVNFNLSRIPSFVKINFQNDVYPENDSVKLLISQEGIFPFSESSTCRNNENCLPFIFQVIPKEKIKITLERFESGSTTGISTWEVTSNDYFTKEVTIKL